MIYRILADVVVGIHFAFVLFVIFGAVWVFRWIRCAWFHVPTVIWATWIEFTGGVCPLTPLENWLREKGDQVGYHHGFIEHYLVPLLYPTSLTQQLQWILGGLVFSLNLALYLWIIHRRRKSKSAKPRDPGP